MPATSGVQMEGHLLVLCPGELSAVAEGSVSPRSERGGEEYLLAALMQIYLICVSR